MKLKPRKTTAVHIFKGRDAIDQMQRKIAAKIHNDQELQEAAMHLPDYARAKWLNDIQPYLRFRRASAPVRATI